MEGNTVLFQIKWTGDRPSFSSTSYYYSPFITGYSSTAPVQATATAQPLTYREKPQWTIVESVEVGIDH